MAFSLYNTMSLSMIRDCDKQKAMTNIVKLFITRLQLTLFSSEYKVYEHVDDA